jgi:hypothetical protein
MASGASPYLANNSQYRNIDDLFLVSRANKIERMSLILDNDADVKIGLFNDELANPISNIPSNMNPEVNLTVTGHVGIRMEADDFTDNNAPLGTGSTPGANGFALKVNGLTYCTNGIWDASDKRFKQNILPLENSLEKIMELKAVNYYFKVEEFKNKGYQFSSRKQYGLIAQELEAVIPELVTMGKDGYKSVNYSALTSVLIHAMQEQQIQMEEQNQRIVELENLLTDIYSRRNPKTNTSKEVELARLYQNNPNPFSEQTTIRFFIPEEYTTAAIYVFDMTGTLITNYNITNQESIEIDGNSLNPGIYNYSLQVDGQIVDSKQLVLTK